MRKVVIGLVSSILFCFTVLAADLTNQIESLSKDYEGFQHTNIIQPSSSNVVWQQYGIAPGDLNEVFTSRVPLGADLIPFPNDVNRSFTFETEGKMKLEVQGIQARTGFITEIVELDNNIAETEKCYDFITQVKVVQLDDPALVSLRRGDKFGLDLPVEENQSRLLELKEIHLDQNGEVDKTIHHGGSSPDITFDPENRCFKLDGFVSGAGKTLEATYYANLD